MTDGFKGAAALIACVCATASQGAIAVYSSAASFNAAAGAATNTATFESFTAGPKGQTLIDSGILFTSLTGGNPAHDVYIAAAGTLTTPAPKSTVLTADGDENFSMQLNSGATFSSVGFDFISNAYNTPTIAFFGVGGISLGSFAITSSKNAMVYFGAISDTPIAYVQTTVDRGYIQDTAYDNVAIRALAPPPSVPEPASWALMLTGFGFMGATMRYRRRSTSTVPAS